MALIYNHAEQGTQGATPSSANTGGNGETALTTQTIGTGCTLTFDSGSAFIGNLGYKYTMPSGSSVADWQLLPGTAIAGRWVFRLYFRLSSVSIATVEFLGSVRNSAAGQACNISIGNDAKLILQNAAGAGQAATKATTALSANTWYRLEVAVTPGTTTGNGTLEYAYYLGHSATPEFTYGPVSTYNTGTTNLRDLRVGRIGAVTDARTIDIDAVAMQDLASGFIGPVSALTASASLSGSGTLTASATPNFSASSALSGSGTLTGAANFETFASASLSGSGTLTGSATPNVSKSVSLGGSGTLSSSRTPGASASGNMSGSGSLIGYNTSLNAKVSFGQSSSGTLTGAVTTQQYASVSLSGSGALSTALTSGARASINASGEGVLSASATADMLVGASLSGAGSLTARVVVPQNISVLARLGDKRWQGGLGPQRWKGSL